MHTQLKLNRRQWLAGAAALCALPARADQDFPRQRVLALTLFGGNDGLNTVVPYRDPLYRHHRPTLALPARSLLTLNDEAALHPSLRFMAERFQRGELAIVQGVGYPDPDLSHFESMAIWNRGARAVVMPPRGWASELLDGQQAAIERSGFLVDVINLDQRADFMAGSNLTMVQASNLPAFMHSDVFDQMLSMPTTASIAEQHLLRSWRQGQSVRQRLRQQLTTATTLDTTTARDGLDIQLQTLLWLLANGVDAPLIKMVHAGYDMHANLLSQHATQLARLDQLLRDLHAGLTALGLWNSTTIFVHSEFGRRVAENGDAGADHGTAGPAFVLGGQVAGGWHGQPAALDALDADGNLQHHVDFRRLYASLGVHAWQLTDNAFVRQGYAPLALKPAQG